MFWMLALRFHSWELLDLLTFMSAAPLLCGSILDSRDPNRFLFLKAIRVLFGYTQGKPVQPKT